MSKGESVKKFPNQQAKFQNLAKATDILLAHLNQEDGLVSLLLPQAITYTQEYIKVSEDTARAYMRAINREAGLKYKSDGRKNKYYII